MTVQRHWQNSRLEMGEVCRDLDTRVGRQVALEILPEPLASNEERRRSRNKARLATALNHPNIMAIYDVGFDQHSPAWNDKVLDSGVARMQARPGCICSPDTFSCLLPGLCSQLLTSSMCLQSPVPMATSSDVPDRRALQTWKEIAAFLGVTVRSVQRWESGGLRCTARATGPMPGLRLPG